VSRKNEFETAEGWLRAAIEAIRAELPPGYGLPEKIDADFGFTSHGKRNGPPGEFWDGVTTSNEIPRLIVRCHTADIDAIMDSLAHQVAHAAVGAEAGHGKAFRDFALRWGLEGKMREAAPGEKLRRCLHDIAESLGPFPRGALAFEKYSANGEERRVVDVSDRQKNRQLKAMCLEDEYIVRVSAQNLRRGVPVCPLCQKPMWHEELPQEPVQRQEPVEKRPVKLPEPALLTYNSAPAIEHQLPGGDDQ
jgi:hypothetical protein